MNLASKLSLFPRIKLPWQPIHNPINKKQAICHILYFLYTIDGVPLEYVDRQTFEKNCAAARDLCKVCNLRH
jgi:hypothetical protein